MTRILYLMRHAEAEKTNDSKTDFDRLLTARGERDARYMGKMISGSPDLVLVSTATRAKKTANIWADSLEIHLEKPRNYFLNRVIYLNQLYQASEIQLLSVIASLKDDIQSVMIIGHNPSLSDISGSLAGKPINLSTAEVITFTIERSWRNFNMIPVTATERIKPIC